VTYQAPITGLHSPTIFLLNSTDYLMLAQSCKFGVYCCFIGLTHPTACTRARVPLTFGHVQTPPLTQFAVTIYILWKCLWWYPISDPIRHPYFRSSVLFATFARKGCQSTGFELRIPMIYLTFRRSDQILEGGSKNLWTPPAPPPPPIRLIYIPIDNS